MFLLMRVANREIERFFLFKTQAFSVVGPGSIARGSEPSNLNPVLQWCLKLRNDIALKSGCFCLTTPTKWKKTKLTRKGLLPSLVPVLIPIIVEFEGIAHMFAISCNCTWQKFGSKETPRGLSDPSVPGSGMDAPHKVVHALMVDLVMFPNAPKDLCKESFPIFTPRMSVKDGILDFRMESSENDPEMFPNTSFFPKVM